MVSDKRKTRLDTCGKHVLKYLGLQFPFPYLRRVGRSKCVGLATIVNTV